MANTSLKSIDAEIKQLEARKKLVEKRDNDVPKAIDVLKKYAAVLTSVQQRQVSKIIGEAVADAPVVKRGRPAGKKAAKKARTGSKIPPKYQLFTGETWTGRGITPKVFDKWARSAEGKAWKKANPDQKFPPAPGAASAATKPVKKAGKKAAKAAKAPAKKARTSAAKKIARKPAKKGTKRAAKKAAA